MLLMLPHVVCTSFRVSPSAALQITSSWARRCLKVKQAGVLPLLLSAPVMGLVYVPAHQGAEISMSVFPLIVQVRELSAVVAVALGQQPTKKACLFSFWSYTGCEPSLKEIFPLLFVVRFPV